MTAAEQRRQRILKKIEKIKDLARECTANTTEGDLQIAFVILHGCDATIINHASPETMAKLGNTLVTDALTRIK